MTSFNILLDLNHKNFSKRYWSNLSDPVQLFSMGDPTLLTQMFSGPFFSLSLLMKHQFHPFSLLSSGYWQHILRFPQPASGACRIPSTRRTPLIHWDTGSAAHMPPGNWAVTVDSSTVPSSSDGISMGSCHSHLRLPEYIQTSLFLR